MSRSVNQVTLVGRLGRDPEVRTLTNGGTVTSLRLATSESWGKGDDKKEVTEWHQVVIFSEPLGAIVEKYCRKGGMLYVQGKIATRKWVGKDGTDKYSTEIIVGKYDGTVLLCGGQSDSTASPDVGAGATRGDEAAAAQPKSRALAPMPADEIPW